MLSIVYIIICIFCLAISIAGIMLCHQWVNTYNAGFHKNYFYYLIAFYTFAFYSIWGQIIARMMLMSLGIKPEIIDSVATTFPILGIPFLFISWIMLINMVYSIFDMAVNRRWYIVHFVLLASMIIGLWIGYAFFIQNIQSIHEGLKYIEVGVLLSFEVIYFILFSILFFALRRRVKEAAYPQFKNFVLLMVIGLILRLVCLLVAINFPWILFMVILVFFASNFIPVIYMQIHGDNMFSPVKAPNSHGERMVFLFKKFEISKREQDVVLLICSGKTNQQIADELFIGLQTVKDHTHRIYTKIGIRSRMQLVQMVGN